MRRLLAATSLACASCTPPHYEGLAVQLHDVPGKSSTDVIVTPERIELPAGLALVLSLQPRDSDGDPYASTDVEVIVEDPTIVTLLPTENTWEYLLVGATVGITCIAVSIRDDEVECLPVNVLDR